MMLNVVSLSVAYTEGGVCERGANFHGGLNLMKITHTKKREK